MEEKEEIIEESSSESMSFELDNFSGPLNLLVTLIKKNKMEIEDIEISKLTEQYLEVMQNISSVDLEIASEFIEYAAYLIELKSKKLLPKIEENQDDEFDDEYMFKLRLREYQMFMEVNEKLKKLESNDKFYKQPEKKNDSRCNNSYVRRFFVILVHCLTSMPFKLL